MDISESKVRSLVEEVISKYYSQGNSYTTSSTPNAPQEIGVFDDLDQAVSAAKKAYEEFKSYKLEDRNKIISSIRSACRKHVEILARMAVEETTFGRYEDKIKKNHLVIDKTPGTEDLVSKSGLAVILKFEPLILNEALSVLPVPATKEYVKVFPESASVEESVPTVEFAATFSLLALVDSAISVGAVLRPVIVKIGLVPEKFVPLGLIS
ncbi:MAG: aldehyde dehydrogenase family protein [Candidatus Sericytochromatia bacterium]